MCLPLGLWHRFTDGRAGNLFNDCIDVNSITEILTKMHESNFQGVCVRRQAQHAKRTLCGNELTPTTRNGPKRAAGLGQQHLLFLQVAFEAQLEMRFQFLQQ